MKANYKAFTLKKIRLGPWLSLIFFALCFACKEDKETAITIVWKNDQAVGIKVPKSLITVSDEKDARLDLEVKLDSAAPAMMGDYKLAKDHIIFSPLIPLTRGLTYSIFFRKEKLGSINVANADLSNPPKVMAIYPGNDTLPENLLKIYLKFSTPMRQGESQRHITLLKRADTLADVFLDLQPELWNTDADILTLWLDPGRIKRDLIPNKKLGNPLENGEQYTLIISGNWKDVQGRSLGESYQHRFQVGVKDTVSPDPATWLLTLPNTNTRNQLIIQFPDPLDYQLLQETISVFDEKGERLMGDWKTLDEEKTIAFQPGRLWSPGDYMIRVAPHLEDLAGNNLDRLFDRDVTKTNGKKISTARSFRLIATERKN